MESLIIAAVLAFNAEAGEHLDPRIFVAIAEVESNLDPYAVNKKSGALGLMQIMPANWEKYGRGEWFDAGENVKAACRLWCAHQFRNDLFFSLCEYNAGAPWLKRKLQESPNPDLGAVADYAYKVMEVIK